MSHTVTVKIEMKNEILLRSAVEAMNGQWLGHGTWNLYAGQKETGLGFTLPNWRYTLIAREDGQLAYDDFSGRWGDVADLDKLKGRYAIEAARQEASNQGWYAEDQPDGSLLIYHPDGGTLSITATGIDANGFTGTGCSAASALIAAAIGSQTAETRKEAYSQLTQTVRAS